MTSGESTGADEIVRLSAIISPLRRGLLRAARNTEGLPDIPDAQVEVLRALPVGSTRSSGELATELGLSRPTVSNLLRAMETAGLVTRHVPSSDGRRVDVAASARAVSLLERFDRAAAEVLAESIAALAESDRVAIETAVGPLERLRDVVQNAASHRLRDDLDPT